MERAAFADALFRLESLAIHADEARRRVIAADAAVIDARAEYRSAADAADAADRELQIARDSLAVAVSLPEPCPVIPGLEFELEMEPGAWPQASGNRTASGTSYFDGGCGDPFTMDDGPLDVGIFGGRLDR